MAETEEPPNPKNRSAAAAPPPVFISSAALISTITHKTLIHHLQTTLPRLTIAIQSPLRHNHHTTNSSSFILMPSWSTSRSFPYIGAKLVTHHPGNSSVNLPGVHAVYVLFTSVTGQPLASIDATELTLYRTACTSALASSYLSREQSETLVVIGAGSLAPHLIRAHLIIRSRIVRVLIWNRTHQKAKLLAAKLREETDLIGIQFESNENLDEIVKLGDIITCATSSELPLVKGVDLKKGAHLDLVGSFTSAMRECDEEAIRRGRVFVDNEAAVVEAGELVGVMGRDEIAGELVEVIKGEKDGRKSLEEITVFKSVGSAAVDLLSAHLVYEAFMNTFNAT